MATPAGSNVWAERAAARQREATVSGGSTNSLNGGSLSQNGKGSGLVGKAVAPEDPGAVTEDRVEVLQESVGFIVGPKVRPIPPDQPELQRRASSGGIGASHGATLRAGAATCTAVPACLWLVWLKRRCCWQGSMINPIAQLTQTQIASPAQGRAASLLHFRSPGMCQGCRRAHPRQGCPAQPKREPAACQRPSLREEASGMGGLPTRARGLCGCRG